MHRPRLSNAWFLPRSFDVLGMLRQQLDIVEQCIHVLNDWGHGKIPTHDAVAELRVAAGNEHRARRTLNDAVRDSFSTPIEAEDLFELGERLGEITEAGYALIRESELSCSGPTCAPPDPYLVELIDRLAKAMVPLAQGCGRCRVGTRQRAPITLSKNCPRSSTPTALRSPISKPSPTSDGSCVDGNCIAALSICTPR